jgi:hypothetical protein
MSIEIKIRKNEPVDRAIRRMSKPSRKCFAAVTRPDLGLLSLF